MPVSTKPSRKRGRRFLIKRRTKLQRFVLQPRSTSIDEPDERAMRGGGRKSIASPHDPLAQDCKIVVIAQQIREFASTV
jgi:hypothetical protein